MISFLHPSDEICVICGDTCIHEARELTIGEQPDTSEKYLADLFTAMLEMARQKRAGTWTSTLRRKNGNAVLHQ